MNTLDIIILIILLIGGLNGLRQGFIKAFANLVGWIFALIVGAKYAVILAPAMSSLSQDPVVQKIAAFAFIVLIIVVCIWIVSALLNGLLKSLKLGWGYSIQKISTEGTLPRDPGKSIVYTY